MDLEELAGFEGPSVGGRSPNSNFEDWSRVLTISRGLVRMAPTVPLNLENKAKITFIEGTQFGPNMKQDFLNWNGKNALYVKTE